MSYRIIDWASNICFGDERFDTFEDGWSYIYDHVRKEVGEDEKAFDETCGEYYVVEVAE